MFVQEILDKKKEHNFRKEFAVNVLTMHKFFIVLEVDLLKYIKSIKE